MYWFYSLVSIWHNFIHVISTQIVQEKIWKRPIYKKIIILPQTKNYQHTTLNGRLHCIINLEYSQLLLSSLTTWKIIKKVKSE